MMQSFIEINGCKHYFINEKGNHLMYFIHSPFFVEKDYELKHPLGKVYKPKGCKDTIIRFVRQPNNRTLIFKANEWNVPKNPFYTGLYSDIKIMANDFVTAYKKMGALIKIISKKNGKKDTKQLRAMRP